ncbi:hypothetical protein [Kaistella antarctica]|uniref:Uncharacterized protein n=1 Tax=Kaistella antarctica TaxID=266748 RepID=A0A3S4UV47_9FLAO|nr:hypothetical protein [Kaistella antarctica]KEY18477.1 hypothetical protein HY04_08140 [Kaistella antarctica]SEV86140.1 hypothetical protein SAMN05421765_0843 [Kaistella antarctica]VEI01273.1 Uncharacterised protein [Kaistella antarctica]
MSTADLKLDLINKIISLKETRIIEEIQKLLDFELEEGVFQASSVQKQRLTEAKNDTVLSGEDANTEIEKWLQEK